MEPATPQSPGWRSAFSLAASLLVHVGLVALVLLTGPSSTRVDLKRGEPLFVELPNTPVPAPRGNPADRAITPPSRTRPTQPSRGRRSMPPPARSAPRVATRPAPEMPAPARIASAPRADAPARAIVGRERPAPTVTPEPRAPRPEARPEAPSPAERVSPLPAAEPRPPLPTTPSGTEPPVGRPEPRPDPPVPVAPRPEAPVARPERPVPDTAKEAPSVGDAPSVASATKDERPVAPPAEAPPAPDPADRPAPEGGGDRLAALRPSQRGGGFRDGRGGIEGEPVPLNTKDPRYNDYFEKLRRMIKDKWVYPREAAERNISGQLMLEFGIAKDGQVRFVELRRSSGVAVLDDYAMNAVKLAQPFPPIPDDLSRSGIPVLAVFNYVIERDVGMLNNILR